MALLCGSLISIVWILWQSVGIEAMRPPWEDEILYTLPAVNLATAGHFSLPQLGHFMDADAGWRWHMPLFPILEAGWVKLAGYQLPVLRLFNLLPAAFLALLLSRCCARLAGQKIWPWSLFWLGLILGDKSFVMNSLTGRMEFWCLLAAIGSIALALDSRKPSALVFAGVLLGLAVGFHPLALFLLPALLWLAVTGGMSGSNSPGFRWRPAMLVMLGFVPVILAIVLWFLSDWPLTKVQFMAQVHGSADTGLAHNAADLLAGLKYNFRFQPLFPIAALAVIGMHLWHILRRRRQGAPGKTVSIGLLLFAAGLIFFLLRGSANHLNYYPPLVMAAMLLLASALPLLRQFPARAQTISLFILFLLLANNLIFMAAKTRTVWRNRDLLNPAPMNSFLATQLAGVNRCVLPPNLWLYAKQHQLNFRVNFLPVVGQPATAYQSYFQSLLDWQPDLIILDAGDAWTHPGDYFTMEQLAASGYVEQDHFNRVFRDRFDYDGYRLVVYRHAAPNG
ncbi:MAG: hypothetical protein ABSE90_00965 [Verrucomicrobiota bacterium]